MSAVRRNLIWLLGSQVASWSVSVLLLVAAPRLLGDVAFGQLAFATVYVSFFELLALFGTGTYLIKTIARVPESVGRYVWNTLVLKLAMNAVLIVAAVGLAVVLGYDEITVQIIAIYSVNMLLTSLNNCLIGGLNGLQQMARPAALDVVRSMVAALLGIAVLRAGGTVLQYASVALLASSVPLFFNYLSSQHLLRGHRHLDVRMWREVLVGGFPFFILSALLVIYGTIDVPLLHAFAGSETVGWYTLAFRWVLMPAFFAASVATAFFPALSAEGARPTTEFARLTNRAVYLVLMVGVPCALGIALIAHRFIDLIYGAEYAESVPIMRILAISIPVIGLDTVLASAIVAADRQRQWVIVSVIAAIVNPLLNLIAIPFSQHHFGNAGIGAATITVLTEVVLMIGAISLRPAGVFDRALVSITARIVLASSLMIPVVLALSEAPLLLQVSAGGIAYGVASIALRTISTAELRQMLHQALRRVPEHAPTVPSLATIDALPAMPDLELEMELEAIAADEPSLQPRTHRSGSTVTATPSTTAADRTALPGPLKPPLPPPG